MSSVGSSPSAGSTSQFGSSHWMKRENPSNFIWTKLLMERPSESQLPIDFPRHSPEEVLVEGFPVGFPPTPPDRIHSQLLQKGEPQSVSQLFESSDGQNWKFTKARMIALGNIYHLILVCWRYLTFKTIRSFDFSNLSSALWSLPEFLHVARIFPK